MSDNVNHPSHYTHYEGLEIIDLTEQMNFNLGNAVKYIARAGLKDPSKEIEDLEKAVFYIRREEVRFSNRYVVYASTYDGLMNRLCEQLSDRRSQAVRDICWKYFGSLEQAAYQLECEIRELKEKV